MAQKQISRFPLNEKFSGLSGLSGHVPNYARTLLEMNWRISLYAMDCAFEKLYVT